jgi:predicted dehydrogenase
MRSTRRDLLTRALGTAGLIAGFPSIVPASVFGANAPSNRVTLGHIGVGNQGSPNLNNFLGVKAGQVVAVCDPYQKRREAAAAGVDQRLGTTGCKAYRDVREMLARDDIDAVVITTPDHWHIPAALLAIRSGKDTYVEKPLGLTIEQDLIAYDAVKRYRSIFQYGTQQRSQSPHIRPGCELIRNGRLGKIHRIDVVAPSGRSGGSTTPIPAPNDFDFDLYQGPAPMRAYTSDLCTNEGSWFQYDHSIGFLGGWGAHPLDVMCWALGDGPDSVPVEVSGTGTIPTNGLFDTVTNWNITGRFANGVEFTFKDGRPDMTTFHGERGTVALSRSSSSVTPDHLRFEVAGPNDVHLHASNNHYADFVHGVRDRRACASTIEAAISSDIISHLADIAIRTGRTIRWDPKQRSIVGDEVAQRMQRRAMRGPWTL